MREVAGDGLVGHRHIAVAAGTAGLTTVADRLAGVATALRERGLSLDDLPVVHSDFTRDGGRVAAERILRDHPRAAAIIALNDAMAIGVLSTLRAHRIPVPERMSVVGFDDVSVAADLAPSLTTIRLADDRHGADGAVARAQAPVDPSPPPVDRPPPGGPRLDRPRPHVVAGSGHAFDRGRTG